MKVNTLDYWKTNRLTTFWTTTSVWFANKENWDTCWLTDSNLMKDWLARHVVWYWTSSIWRDAVRCQPRCWNWTETNQFIEVLWYIR